MSVSVANIRQHAAISQADGERQKDQQTVASRPAFAGRQSIEHLAALAASGKPLFGT